MTPAQHGSRRGRSTELLYDADIPTPTHAERARTLAASVATGALGTSMADADGHPYASHVTFALWGAWPVFLISRLATHTQNLEREPRASLLLVEPQPEGGGSTQKLGKRGKDPLALGRVSLLGTCERLTDGDEAAAKSAFVEAHPGAGYYADFTDFGVWALRVARARYIGGYGRMSWVEGEAWCDAEADPIAPAARGIIRHMNDDHLQAMRDYCRAFSRAGEVDEVVMTGVDRYGFDMSATTSEGPRPIRVAFDQPVANAGEVRAAMVALVKRARGEGAA